MSKPSPDAMIRKSLSLPAELWDRLGAWRHDQRIGTEAQAARQLLTAALDAAEQVAPPVKAKRAAGKNTKGESA